MKSKTYIEVRLRANVDSGELLFALEGWGPLGGWEEGDFLHLYWDEDKWDPAVLEQIPGALARLGSEEMDIGLRVNAIPDRDWNAAWAASLLPIRIGRRIRIRQSWTPADPAFTGIELVMDPGRAFGSGYHATTQLVMEWMEDRLWRGDAVLDVGTGSGILAMTAIRLGAACALGIDSDPVAIECARELAAANGFGPELRLCAVSFEDIGEENFDVVLANLDGRTLPLLCAALPRILRVGGYACLSGLQPQDCEDIEGALKAAGFSVTARMERGGWNALETRKANPSNGQGTAARP